MHGTIVLLLLSLIRASETPPVVLPPCFRIETVASGFTGPVAIAFPSESRMFVAEKGGRVWLVDGDVRLPDPFLDLRGEVGDAGDRGLLGIAVHPEFASTPWVYLLYVVDPVFGQPDEPATTPAFGRLTRYRSDPASGGATALLDSREVLIGATASEGFIHCHSSHAVGTVRFAPDGSLLVGTGDGAHFNLVDSGGEDPECFATGMFDAAHDIGAFRAQDLDSFAGKILRVDLETGHGLPTNPFWTGRPEDAQSKVWTYGLRNPFRFSVRPGVSPLRLYIGDVGWNTWEEVNVARGGDNFGWPCYEGMGKQPSYFTARPAHHDCTTLKSDANPGPLTLPLLAWHHSDAAQSVPSGLRGRCAVGGAFYTRGSFPPPYSNVYYFADFVDGWIATLTVTGADEVVSVRSFASGLPGLVAVETHPVRGDLYVVRLEGRVERITYRTDVFDDDRDCDVDLADMQNFFTCVTIDPDIVPEECLRFDADRDNHVSLADYRKLTLTGPVLRNEGF